MRRRPDPAILAMLIPCALAVAVACGPRATEEPPRRAPFESLIETEREFSRLSGDHGMKVAFLRYLDDEAILFRPHPVNGKEHTMLQPESGVHLGWEPTRAGIAGAGDLGWTTGPYRVEPEQEGEPPLYGYFVSIWKRQKTDRWKVLMDLGTVNPSGEPCAEEAELTPPVEIVGEAPASLTSEALARLEEQLSTTVATEGAPEAYAPLLSAGTRLYRDGRCPARDGEAIGELLRSLPGVPSWETRAVTVAESGDLAYSYGAYRLADREAGTHLEEGYYVRIWEATPAGTTLRLEITSPVPLEGD
jgi:ketosteroid isomerase-like protein